MSTIRRIDASKYKWTDPRRYITLKDCLSEPELLKAYCENHPNAVCLGGYMFHGCCPEEKKKEDFVIFNREDYTHTRKDDGKVLQHDETYCGRKIPRRIWDGKEYLESRIWTWARLGIPDLEDGNLIIEAKGGMPSSTKAHTAFGQLLFYKEHEPNLQFAFLFPRVWLEAENLQNHWNVFRKYGITLLPI